MFVQMFGFLKKSAEVCKSCEWGADLFKGCKHLDSVNKQDSSEVQCRNCVYTGDHLCTVRDDE